MNPNYDEQLLLAYVEGDLDAAGRQQVEGWMSKDPELSQMLRGMMSDREVMLDVPQELAPEWILEDITRSMERDMLLDGLPGGTVPVEQEVRQGTSVLAKIGVPLGAVAATLVIGMIAASLYFSGVVDFEAPVLDVDEMASMHMAKESTDALEPSTETESGLPRLESPMLASRARDSRHDRIDPPASRAPRTRELTESINSGNASNFSERPDHLTSDGSNVDPNLIDEANNIIGNNVITSLNRSNDVVMEIARNELTTQGESSALQETLFHSRNVASLNINASSLEEANAMLVAFANEHQLQQFSGKVVDANSGNEWKKQSTAKVVAQPKAPKSNAPASLDRQRIENSELRLMESEDKLKKSSDAQKTQNIYERFNNTTKQKNGDASTAVINRQQIVTLVVPEDQAELIIRKLNQNFAPGQDAQQMMQQQAVAPQQTFDQPKESQAIKGPAQPGNQAGQAEPGRNSRKPDAQNSEKVEQRRYSKPLPEKKVDTLSNDEMNSPSPSDTDFDGQKDKQDVIKRKLEHHTPARPVVQQPAQTLVKGVPGRTHSPSGETEGESQVERQSAPQQQLVVQDWKPDDHSVEPDQDRSSSDDWEQWGIPLTRLQNILQHSRMQQKSETDLVTIQVIIQENK